jgi:hypothetical protein
MVFRVERSRGNHELEEVRMHERSSRAALTALLARDEAG